MSGIRRDPWYGQPLRRRSIRSFYGTEGPAGAYILIRAACHRTGCRAGGDGHGEKGDDHT